MPESFAIACQRQILARKRRPCKVSLAWQQSRSQGVDIILIQLAATPITPVCGSFGRVEVVGEEASPPSTQPGASHAAASKKFVEGRHSASHGACPFMHESTYTRAKAAVKQAFIARPSKSSLIGQA